jgi:hypothetical protein
MQKQSREETISIAGIDSPVILQYFQTLNAGDFVAISRLFAPDGALQPPFEEVVIGPEAIAQYLQQEAQGIRCHPTHGIMQLADNGCHEASIVGQVQTPWFGVKVSWFFALSPQQEIFLVKVSLRASLPELLKLRTRREFRL